MNAIESGLLPTPTANDATGSEYAYSKGDHSKKTLKLPGAAKRRLYPTPTASVGGPEVLKAQSEKHTGLKLETAARLYPTPTSRDYRDTGDCTNVPVNGLLGRTVHPSQEMGSLNPDWVELLMGYPAGWTRVDGGTETGKEEFNHLPKRFLTEEKD